MVFARLIKGASRGAPDQTEPIVRPPPFDDDQRLALEIAIGRIVKAIESGNRGWLAQAIRAEIDWRGFPVGRRWLYLAQLGECALCRSLIEPMPFWAIAGAPSREHVVPAHKGGGGGTNIVLSHRSCNSRRGGEIATPELHRFRIETWARIARWSKVVATAREKYKGEIGSHSLPRI